MKIKIIIIGDFHSKIHEEPLFNAFKKLNCQTFNFAWSWYFKNYPYKLLADEKGNFFTSIYYRFQYKFALGPVIKKINQDILEIIIKNNIKNVFVYNGRLIYPKTLQTLRKSGCIVIGYNNDDPFSPKYPKYFWRHFIKSIKEYNHIFAYREKNIIDYRNLHFSSVSLLRSFYIKDYNYPIKNQIKTIDVIFAGHYENDNRDEYIKAIIDNGINFKLYGPEWKRSKHYNYFINKLGQIDSLSMEEYNRVLNSTKIALVFLSALNNDTYTRRCFEIPATKTFMLSQYSTDLGALFEEKKEIDFFRSQEELIEKIAYYLIKDSLRAKIGESGYKRILKDKHEVTYRAMEIIKKFLK